MRVWELIEFLENVDNKELIVEIPVHCTESRMEPITTVLVYEDGVELA